MSYFISDGGWTDWVPETSCSVTCGGGKLTQTRQCTNPLPAYGGANCLGSATQIIACNTLPCYPGKMIHQFIKQFLLTIKIK